MSPFNPLPPHDVLPSAQREVLAHARRMAEYQRWAVACHQDRSRRALAQAQRAARLVIDRL